MTEIEYNRHLRRLEISNRILPCNIIPVTKNNNNIWYTLYLIFDERCLFAFYCAIYWIVWYFHNNTQGTSVIFVRFLVIWSLPVRLEKFKQYFMMYFMEILIINYSSAIFVHCSYMQNIQYESIFSYDLYISLVQCIY